MESVRCLKLRRGFSLSGLPSEKELVLVVEDLRIPYVSSGN